MKPVIPSDPASLAAETEAGADAGREESSLHDNILTRLRDYIVEGNIPDGGGMLPSFFTSWCSRSPGVSRS